jgi:hypothetical protein
MEITFNSLSVGARKDFLDEHLHYELDMFFFSLRTIIDFKNRGDFDEKIFHINMALEDFLLHSRNLLEFFYHPNNTTSKYAYAGHFFTGNNWDVFNQRRQKILDYWKENNEVVHL